MGSQLTLSSRETKTRQSSYLLPCKAQRAPSSLRRRRRGLTATDAGPPSLRPVAFATLASSATVATRGRNILKGAPLGAATSSRSRSTTRDAATNCSRCAHGSIGRCGYGCDPSSGQQSENVIVERVSELFAGSKIPSSGDSSQQALLKLAEMAKALEAACRKDAAALTAAEEAVQKKLAELKAFAEIMHEVPPILRRFLLLRIGSIEEDVDELKAWVSPYEATEAHRALEQFRDEAGEEKTFRRLRASMMVSAESSCAGSYSFVSSPPGSPVASSSCSSSHRCATSGKKRNKKNCKS